MNAPKISWLILSWQLALLSLKSTDSLREKQKGSLFVAFFYGHIDNELCWCVLAEWKRHMRYAAMLANSAEYWVVALYSTLAITGLLGNIWVMLSVLGEWCRCCHPQWPHMRCKSAVNCSANIYLIILSVVDLISILPVPLLATDILYNEWPFGLLLCKLLFFCEGANKSLSPLVLTALSFSIFVLIACFLLSLFFIMPVVYYAGINDMVDANYKEHPKCVVQMSKNYDIVHVCICYLLPLLLICSVYVGILRRLYQHTRTSTVGRRTSISLGRVLKCSVFVVAFYFVCWTPYWTLRVVAVLQEPSELPLAVHDVEMVLNGSLDFVPNLRRILPDEDRAGEQATHEVAIMYMECSKVLHVRVAYESG
uniref:G-protein coupled receptors family 1 profile domain-containing protein n=1 Tax=Parascaris equorum TaxID=6256 RepID=A0A914RP46_PAREQ